MCSLQWQTVSQKSTYEQSCGLRESSDGHRIPFLGLSPMLSPRDPFLSPSTLRPPMVAAPSQNTVSLPFPLPHHKQSSVATHSWVLASPSRTINGFAPPWTAASVTHIATVAPSKWTQTHRRPTLASKVHMLSYFDSMLLIRYLQMWIIWVGNEIQ